MKLYNTNENDVVKEHGIYCELKFYKLTFQKNW